MPILRYNKTKGPNAAKDNKDTAIPAGKTFIIRQIDFTAPAQQSAGVKVFAGPNGNPEAVLVAAGQMDKLLTIPQGNFGEVAGPLTVRCQLDNSNNPNGAFLGCNIYYEEL